LGLRSTSLSGAPFSDPTFPPVVKEGVAGFLRRAGVDVRPSGRGGSSGGGGGGPTLVRSSDTSPDTSAEPSPELSQDTLFFPSAGTRGSAAATMLGELLFWRGRGGVQTLPRLARSRTVWSRASSVALAEAGRWPRGVAPTAGPPFWIVGKTIGVGGTVSRVCIASSWERDIPAHRIRNSVAKPIKK